MPRHPFEPSAIALKTIITPDLPGAPDHVKAALAAQSAALDDLFAHFDDTEHVTADDWEEQAEATMLILAAADKPYEHILDERRTERVAAITKHRRLEQTVRRTAREARAAVHDWLTQPGVLDELHDADEAARAAELDALSEFASARRKWLRTAAVTQWCVAAAAAVRAASVPDYNGRDQPTNDGMSIEARELQSLSEYVDKEHRRADHGASTIAGDSLVILKGDSGVEFAVPRSAASGLVSSKQSSAHLVDDIAGDDDSELAA